MKIKLAIGAIAVILVGVVFFYYFNSGTTLSNNPATTSVVGSTAVQNELSRLASLTANNQTTLDDLTTLSKMVKGDPSASDEFDELSVMIKYKEYSHAQHSIGFMAAYAANGQEFLCPGHALSHYYVFSRHNESNLANNNLEDAKAQLPDWIPKARDFDQKYPTGQAFDDMLASVNYYIGQIGTGNTTISEGEINYLSNFVICIPK